MTKALRPRTTMDENSGFPWSSCQHVLSRGELFEALRRRRSGIGRSSKIVGLAEKSSCLPSPRRELSKFSVSISLTRRLEEPKGILAGARAERSQPWDPTAYY